jgi:hypothetical protein
VTINTGLHVVTDDMWHQAQLEQQQRELRVTFLKLGIEAFDAVLDSLPESSRACVWLDEAIHLAQKAKETIDG